MAQLVYNRSPDVAFEGMEVDGTPQTNVTKKQAESSAGIPIGVFVKKGTGDDDVLLPTTNADVIEGITFYSAAMQVLNYTDNPPKYAPKSPVNVKREGRVWMKTEQAVVPTDPVFYRYAAGGASSALRGTVRKDADTNGAVRLPGARFLTTAAANGLVQVEYSKKAQEAALYGASLP